MGIGEGKATREPSLVKANALKDRLPPFLPPSLSPLAPLAFNPCESQRRVRANRGAPARQEPNPRRPSLLLHLWGSSSSREPPCPSPGGTPSPSSSSSTLPLPLLPTSMFLQTNLPSMRVGH